MTMVLLTWAYHERFEKQMRDDLKVYAQIIQTYEDIESLKRVAVLKDAGIRITIIEKDGSVGYDNQFDSMAMENHNTRPEVVAAWENGEGTDVRNSTTLDQSTYYYAIALADGRVLRVSQEADNVISFVFSALPSLILILCFILVISLGLAHLLTGALISPIQKLAVHLEDSENITYYEELRPFIAKIRKQHQDLRHSAKMREEFTANVTHELKTPLTSISGYAELIETGMASGEDVTRFAQGIQKNSQRLLRLIDDIIRLAELDVDNGALETERLNLYAMAGDCVEMLEASSKKHGVTLTLRGEDSFIMGNRIMIEEVLYNLCDNAIRYNKEGGSVVVEVEDGSTVCNLRVADTGIGIKEEHRERIFERFYRVDKSRSKKTGGTGLGLAIVKHIVARHEAALTIESEWGKGTTMQVSFPKAEAKET